jgi:hypothetical protein
MKNIKYEISLLEYKTDELTAVYMRVVELENKILDRLKQQYKIAKKTNNIKPYYAMRLFCLDCELITFNDIEIMEYEVNQSF